MGSIGTEELNLKIETLIKKRVEKQPDASITGSEIVFLRHATDQIQGKNNEENFEENFEENDHNQSEAIISWLNNPENDSTSSDDGEIENMPEVVETEVDSKA